eukprot:CAMPEP_0172553772 /NCGR_PEP_ID=MMETSP1067-20121228/51651_1 /TAXON_ID=265564 ORGANISM="Thalassiosira punctigera, Strain Tpunct2005C2" /NCGR_SAMPLE_ID=MMETSP1067 /ASSEMBLY_ACC=CAM_ASM_000444 /LENGTH=61 /DNA_ID=CAMNT_0013342003 /DNA_START=375 /DNA_END=560 /DNA_ORIENTATION=+
MRHDPPPATDHSRTVRSRDPLARQSRGDEPPIPPTADDDLDDDPPFWGSSDEHRKDSDSTT